MADLTAIDVTRILAGGLFNHMLNIAGSRSEGCDAIGQVLTGTLDENPVAFLFKHEINTNRWELTEVSPENYKSNMMIYYHENEKDSVTQAALHGDEIAPDFVE